MDDVALKCWNCIRDNFFEDLTTNNDKIGPFHPAVPKNSRAQLYTPYTSLTEKGWSWWKSLSVQPTTENVLDDKIPQHHEGIDIPLHYKCDECEATTCKLWINNFGMLLCYKCMSDIQVNVLKIHTPHKNLNEIRVPKVELSFSKRFFRAAIPTHMTREYFELRHTITGSMIAWWESLPDSTEQHPQEKFFQ